jgi:hypothetical protein
MFHALRVSEERPSVRADSVRRANARSGEERRQLLLVALGPLPLELIGDVGDDDEHAVELLGGEERPIREPERTRRARGSTRSPT